MGVHYRPDQLPPSSRPLCPPTRKPPIARVARRTARSALLGAALLAGACDLRIGDSLQPDAGADAAEPADAAPTIEAIRIDELSAVGSSEDDPSLTGDELE